MLLVFIKPILIRILLLLGIFRDALVLQHIAELVILILVTAVLVQAVLELVALDEILDKVDLVLVDLRLLAKIEAFLHLHAFLLHQ